MLRIILRKTGWLLGAITLAVAVVLSLNARPLNPPAGEWMQTSFSSAHGDSCVGGSCHEWCQPLGHGPSGDLIPTGLLCCIGSSGVCVPGTEFVP